MGKIADRIAKKAAKLRAKTLTPEQNRLMNRLPAHNAQVQIKNGEFSGAEKRLPYGGPNHHRRVSHIITNPPKASITATQPSAGTYNANITSLQHIQAQTGFGKIDPFNVLSIMSYMPGFGTDAVLKELVLEDIVNSLDLLQKHNTEVTKASDSVPDTNQAAFTDIDKLIQVLEDQQEAQLDQDNVDTYDKYGNYVGPNKPDKGEKDGSCNITRCQKPGATFFNKSMRRWYCPNCAEHINWPGGRKLTMELYGVPLLCEDSSSPTQFAGVERM